MSNTLVFIHQSLHMISSKHNLIYYNETKIINNSVFLHMLQHIEKYVILCSDMLPNILNSVLPKGGQYGNITMF